jgi:hypothetical protein
VSQLLASRSPRLALMGLGLLTLPALALAQNAEHRGAVTA